MANYSINLTDNLNGTFSLNGLLRAPTTLASGGTELSSTFATAVSSNTVLALGDAVQRALNIVVDDRAKNG